MHKLILKQLKKYKIEYMIVFIFYIINVIFALLEPVIFGRILDSIINNVGIAVLLWFLGSTVIGFPLIYVVVGYKGYCIGYTVSSVMATVGTGKGIIFIIATMLIQNIIYIPTILTLSVSGIKLYRLIMEDRRRENIKLQILKHTIFSILMLILLLISSLLETYVSGNLSSIFLKYC
mgnify:CR=1 FL=1